MAAHGSVVVALVTRQAGRVRRASRTGMLGSISASALATPTSFPTSLHRGMAQGSSAAHSGPSSGPTTRPMVTVCCSVPSSRSLAAHAPPPIIITHDCSILTNKWREPPERHHFVELVGEALRFRRLL